MLDELVTQVANYGFPAIVAAYVLVRIEPTIRELTKTVSVLTIVVAKSVGMDLDTIKEATNTK